MQPLEDAPQHEIAHEVLVGVLIIMPPSGVTDARELVVHPNIDLLKFVMSRTSKPVVASGGISSLNDIRDLKALVHTGLEGAILGKALYAKNFRLEEAIEIADQDDI
jgi:uncharacterized protein related to proFAR isomerase